MDSFNFEKYDPYSVLTDDKFKYYLGKSFRFVSDNLQKKAISTVLANGVGTLFAVEFGHNVSMMYYEYGAKTRDISLMRTELSKFNIENSVYNAKKDICAFIALRSGEYCSLSNYNKHAKSNPFRLNSYIDDFKSIGEAFKKRSISAFVDDRTEKTINERLNAKAFICRRISMSIMVYLYNLNHFYDVNNCEIIDWLIDSGYKWFNLPEKLFSLSDNYLYDACDDFLEYKIPNDIEILGGYTIKYIINNIKQFEMFWSYLEK